MPTLEREFVEKFRLLDKDSQRRVFKEIEQELEVSSPSRDEQMSVEAWLGWAQEFGVYVQGKYGDVRPNSTDLLNEAREERLDDLLGGR